jgi:quinol monooxygenase YgiN
MAIYQTARFRVRPEGLARCEAAIREFIEYIKSREPGTLLYISLQDAQDPTNFLHYFIFQDDEAREQHANSEGVHRFTDILYPQTLASVEFTDYIAFASTRRADTGPYMR